MTKLMLFVFILLSPCHLIGQFHTFFNYSVKDGLPSSEVYDVFQDSNGFIWFATDNGVVRFDGNEMEVFRGAQGLDDPVVFGIQEDSRGRIWFRTFSLRLFYFENGRIFPYKYNDRLSQACRHMMTTYVDSSDQVWFASHVRGRITASGTVITDSIPAGYLFYKPVDHGSITGIGARVYSSSKLENVRGVNIGGAIYEFGDDVPLGRSLSFGIVWNNKTYIVFGKSIFEVSGNAIQKAFSAPAQIISAYKDRDNQLWIGYLNNGVHRFSNQDFTDPTTIGFLKTKSVSKVLHDSEGGIWITSLESGAWYLPDLSIVNNPYPHPSKVEAAAGFDDKVFFSHYNSKISVFQENERGCATVLDALSDPIFLQDRQILFPRGSFRTSRAVARPVMTFFRDRNKTIWMSPILLDMQEDDRQIIWGFGEGTVNRFDQQGKFLSCVSIKPELRTAVLDDSVIYMAMRLGLEVRDTAMRLIDAPASLAKMKISKLLHLNDTTLFVATIGNGFLVANKRDWSFQQFSSANQFFADNLYTAAKRDTSIWLGTEKGIVIVDVGSLVRGVPAYRHISKARGLLDDRVNFLAFTNKSAWAFFDEGVSSIPYTTAGSDGASPGFYVKSLLISNKVVDGRENLTFPYNENDVKLSFGYVSMKNQNITSRYRLNKNDEWTYTRDRSLRFALAPGEYSVELEYSADNSHWISSGMSMAFSITPPWWQRWYFQLVMLCVVAGSVYLYFQSRYRMRQQQQQRLMRAEIETLERERNRIAQELHDGVATNLGAIKLMVNQLLKVHNAPMANELDEHFLSTITEIKNIIYGLTPPGLECRGLFAGIKVYVEKLNRSIPIKIHLDIAGNDIYVGDLGVMSFRIIQELLSNAVRHSGAKNISIALNSLEGDLKISFSDDGTGFVYDPARSGLGLSNIESRVQSVGGKLKFESGSSGTIYFIRIPYVSH